MKISENAYEFAQLLLKNYKDEAKFDYEKEQEKFFESLVEKGDTGNSEGKNQEKKWDDIDKGFKNLEDMRERQEELDKNKSSIWGCTNDHRKERDIYERPNKEKLETCDYFKQEGNKAFKSGDLDKASYMYQKAQLYLVYTIAETEEEERKFDKLSLTTNLNLAAVKLRTKEYREAMNFCYQALKFDPDNLKAKFRMCKAHIELSEYTKAQEIINEVLEKQPKNTDFANLRKDLNNAISENDKTIKKASKFIGET